MTTSGINEWGAKGMTGNDSKSGHCCQLRWHAINKYRAATLVPPANGNTTLPRLTIRVVRTGECGHAPIPRQRGNGPAAKRDWLTSCQINPRDGQCVHGEGSRREAVRSFYVLHKQSKVSLCGSPSDREPGGGDRGERGHWVLLERGIAARYPAGVS